MLYSVRRVFKLGPKKCTEQLFLGNTVLDRYFGENAATDSTNFVVDYPFKVSGGWLPYES
jgi:hypothetical protein